MRLHRDIEVSRIQLRSSARRPAQRSTPSGHEAGSAHCPQLLLSTGVSENHARGQLRAEKCGQWMLGRGPMNLAAAKRALCSAEGQCRRSLGALASQASTTALGRLCCNCVPVRGAFWHIVVLSPSLLARCTNAAIGSTGVSI